MKGNNLLKILMFSLLTVSLVSCGETSNSDSNNPSSDVSTEISSEVSSDPLAEIVDNEAYTYPFEELDALKGTNTFSITSTGNYAHDLKLSIDNSPVDKIKPNCDAAIRWDANPQYPVHSFGVEHAKNEITFNGEVIGVLPRDDAEAVNIPNLSLYEGQNVFSLTIGRHYADKAWNKNEPHGGLEGGGDDFQIKNMRVEMPDGSVIFPTKMVIYKPVSATSSKYVTREIQQPVDEYYWLGDGWTGSLSYEGSGNPRTDIPFQIDYYFDIYTPDSLATYSVDTTKYEDGIHTLTVKDENNIVLQNNVYFDNTAPAINTNIIDNASINNNFKLTAVVDDATSGIVEKSIKVDGKEITKNKTSLDTLTPGQHNVTFYGKDKAGNTVYDSKDFVIRSNVDVLDVSVNNKNMEVNSPYDASLGVKVYEANKLNYTSKTPLNTKQTSNYETTPYDEFIVNVSDTSKPLYISYNGETLAGEKIVIEALNPSTNEYELVTYTMSNQEVNFTVNPASFVSNGQIKFKVSPYYLQNGSNKMFWTSDTQYLPVAQFTDLHYMYTELMEYTATEYENGNIGYFIHTGDIVDDAPSYGDSAVQQWILSSKAFEVLDNRDIPYGVCAGNHDVGTDLKSLDYSLYSTYFGNFRFNDKLYFGGSLNDNECHYDLVTIGEFDFIIMYLGFGVEATPTTISWANKVLQTYKHRNAIIATHSYLSNDGLLEESTQAVQIYEQIVVPNENVKFVFSGHDTGNARLEQEIGDRVVHAILNCYQRIEKGSYSIVHKINGSVCNGEAFSKELTFKDGKMYCKTFSPVTKAQFPINGNDNFNIEVDLISSSRELTSSKFEVYQAGGTPVYEANDVSSTSTLSNIDNNKQYVVYVNDGNDGYGFALVN